MTKYKTGDRAYVMDRAEFVVNNTVHRIPLGTEVQVRAVSVLKARKAPVEVRYEVVFDGGPLVCWVDEDRLSPKVIEVA